MDGFEHELVQGPLDKQAAYALYAALGAFLADEEDEEAE